METTKHFNNILFLYMVCAVGLRVVAQIISMRVLRSMEAMMTIEIISDIVASVVILPLLIFIFYKTNALSQNVINKKKLDARGLFLGVVSIWMSSITGSALLGLASHVLSHEVPNENSRMLLTWMGDKDWLTLVMLYISVSLCAPIVEELIFRGIIFKGLRVKFHFGVAACISAILFAALHLDAYAAIGTFLMGMVFARLYETYGNLTLNIIVHCVYNSFVFYTLVSMDDIVEPESSVLADFITFVVSCAILLLSCRAIYKRNTKKVKK